MHQRKNLIAITLLVWLFAGSPLFAQAIAFVSNSNAGFEKDVKKNLNKDSRRTKTDLSIESLDKFLSSDLSAYKKVAVIAYTKDMKGALLTKLQKLQSTEPDKYVLWLTYKGKTAPKIPEGLDAASSASTQKYGEYAYGKSVVPHLFG